MLFKITCLKWPLFWLLWDLIKGSKQNLHLKPCWLEKIYEHWSSCEWYFSCLSMWHQCTVMQKLKISKLKRTCCSMRIGRREIAFSSCQYGFNLSPEKVRPIIEVDLKMIRFLERLLHSFFLESFIYHTPLVVTHVASLTAKCWTHYHESKLCIYIQCLHLEWG